MPLKDRFDTRSKLPENPAPGKGRFPEWLHRKLPRGSTLFETNKTMRKAALFTVCEEAKCPNRLECFSKKTATFLACGSACTRACGFCDIDFAKNPLPLDPDEPHRIAEASATLGLKHVVITMVARDDLEDQGAGHIAKIITAVREKISGVTIEVLTSDFSGDLNALDIVLEAKPEIFNHNIETVRALSPRVRHKATYDRTLHVLKGAKERGAVVKSGIMVGLGETEEQVEETLRDLHAAQCDIVTIGQYLQASKNKLRVHRFVTPEEFARYKTYGEGLGIRHVYSGPFVRSSYNAGEVRQVALAPISYKISSKGVQDGASDSFSQEREHYQRDKASLEEDT